MNYRQIWENIYGEIPVDEAGRSYEIHHIDGNRTNNDISNLRCVSIKEHYEIHQRQNDWGACFLIKKRMNCSPEELSELSKKHNKTMLENGTHNFLTLVKTEEHKRNIGLANKGNKRPDLAEKNKMRKGNNSFGFNKTHSILGAKLFHNIETKEHKYYMVGQEPEGWILGSCDGRNKGSRNPRYKGIK